MISAQAALACEAPICMADPETLELARIVTFEDSPAAFGPGYKVSDLMVMEGIVFGEHFSGQQVTAEGNHDAISGQASAPLSIVAGAAGQNLSVVYFNGTRVLNGYGVAGFPKRDGQGEGAIAFQFDNDQSALSFQLRGGEDGAVQVLFLARNGESLATLDLPNPGEHHFGFARRDGIADIAGVVITNRDPQGIAVDNIRFEKKPGLS